MARAVSLARLLLAACAGHLAEALLKSAALPTITTEEGSHIHLWLPLSPSLQTGSGNTARRQTGKQKEVEE